MNKKIIFAAEARKGLLDGVMKLSDAVVSTLGPSGRNVIIEQTVGSPASTKDGVTVAKAVELEDRVENIGAQLVKQAAIKTAEQAGDGTTTSTLLAGELYKTGLDCLEKESNAVDIKKGISLAVTDAVTFLEDLSRDITDEKQIRQIATVSANNDPEVGELIATALDKVGRDGVVTIEESKTGETYLETVEGMQFDRGYKSPYFVTDNSTMQTILKDPLILIVDKRLNQIKELLPVLEAVSSQNKSLLIVAEDIEGEALSTLIVNKMRGILTAVAVKAPGFGDRRTAMMEDIAILTGGKVISTEKGMRLDKFDTTWLGKAKKVTVGKDHTTIIDAQGAEEALTQRIEDIKVQIDESTSNFEKEVLQDRLAKFIGGVSIIHVGGHTEVEMKEKKDRVDDALHATTAALEEGILPGGGIALLRAASIIQSKEALGVDVSKGYNAVIAAIRKPFNQILTNAGMEEATITTIREKITEDKDNWTGWDIRNSNPINMFEAGIIDPTKVTRLALENAASVAGTMLITETVISNIKDDNSQPEMDPGMFGGM